MADVEKRFQVFVSSTFEDLIKERQEVMHALLELDCMPAGMELFPAASDDQWTLIQQVIAECDYYLLIVGGRYGSVDADGVSYTKKEYRFAVDIGKPVLGFVHGDPGSISATKTEASDEGKTKLKAFRELVETKTCKKWATPEELGSVVSRSVVKLIKQQPAVGWVRGDTVPSRDAVAEIVRLQRQVQLLEAELSRIATEPPPGTKDLAQGQDDFEFEFTFRDNRYDLCIFRTARTWDDLFVAISPLMIDEAPEGDVQARIDSYLDDWASRGDGPETYDRQAAINDTDFHTIKVQLRALGLIQQSVKPKRSVKDTGTYWTLTPYGSTYMTKLIAVKKDGKK